MKKGLGFFVLQVLIIFFVQARTDGAVIDGAGNDSPPPLTRREKWNRLHASNIAACTEALAATPRQIPEKL